jgi:hypothetical protein
MHFKQTEEFEHEQQLGKNVLQSMQIPQTIVELFTQAEQIVLVQEPHKKKMAVQAGQVVLPASG